MNDNRRKQIQKVIDTLEEMKAEVESIAADERQYYDDMPENLQGGEKGTKADQTAETLEGIESDLDEIINNLFESMQ